MRQGFGSKGGYRLAYIKAARSFCMSKRANTRWLQDGPTGGQAEPIVVSSSTSGITDLMRKSIFKETKREQCSWEM